MAVVDVERLFKQFSVLEVKDIEKKVKADIERKKEDLRQMVGRRYRDIIEAADNIKEMKNSSEEILNSLRHVQKSLGQLENLQHQLSYVQQKAKFRTGSNVGVAFSNQNSCKFLADLNELVWQSLDENKCLDASFFFILADHVYRSIKIQSQRTNDAFVERIWKVIQPRRVEILQCASVSLSDVNATDSIKIDCLCAILLVDNLKIEDVFVRFLKIREDCLKNLFENVDTASREKICAVLNLLQNTISSSFNVLIGSNLDDNQLAERFRTLQNGTFESSIFTNYLKLQNRSFVNSMPAEMKNFRCHIEFKPIDVTFLTDRTKDWLEKCLTLCREKIDELLPYFESVESLTTLKFSILEVLHQHASGSEWRSACEKLLGNEFSLWFSLCSTPLQKRIQEIIKNLTKTNFNQLLNEIGKLSDEKSTFNEQSSFSNFLWRNLPTDDPNLNAKKLKTSSYTIPLKANGVSTDVFDPCFSLDSKISSLKEGVEKFLDLNDYLEVRKYFEIRSDFIWQTFAECLSSSIFDLISSLDEKGMMKLDANVIENKTFSVVKYSKLCRCLAELSPNLKSVILWQDENVEKSRRSQTPDVWSDLKTKLTNASICLLNVWSKFVIDNVSASFLSSNSSFDYNFWLSNAQEWEAVEIQEEAEDGRKVSSKIFVPNICSNYVHRCLYSVCQWLCSVGAHTFPRESMASLNRRLFLKFVEFYEFLLNKQTAVVRQKQALQILFDFKFLNSFLNWKLQNSNGEEETTASVEKRIETIINTLENVVDPFDLDVMAPYLKRSVAKQVQKCQAIYGVLLTANAVFTNLRTSSIVGGSSFAVEQPHVLTLSVGSTGRFHLLPIHQDSTKNILGTKTALKNVSAIKPSDKRGVLASSEGLRQSSSTSTLTSFYDKLSSSWFGT